MKQIISSEKIPIKIWAEDVEEGALVQAKNLANLPFAFHHIAIMPDVHQGYGMPIGGILTTQGVVIPNAVGVDIGCGMCAVKTSIQEIDANTIKQILGGSKEFHGGIRSCVPVGFNRQSKKQDEGLMPREDFWATDVINSEYQSALKQIGTLGGGNHFIEIQQGSDGFIWVMIHSGSRNLGFKVAGYYNKLSRDLNTKWFTSVDKKFDLAFLPLDSKEGQAYIREMKYCVEFAFTNRKLMMDNVKNCILAILPDTQFDDMINIAHNYATLEHHFGKNVMVHRKGATQARKGQIGIIPGSQGTASYIVKGLGNPESFESCSHGAGRLMSRTKARTELNLEVEKAKLYKLGVIHGIRNQKDLDEAAGAYKDISEVMSNQTDLVEVVVELKPIAVIKG